MQYKQRLKHLNMAARTARSDSSRFEARYQQLQILTTFELPPAVRFTAVLMQRQLEYWLTAFVSSSERSPDDCEPLYGRDYIDMFVAELVLNHLN